MTLFLKKEQTIVFYFQRLTNRVLLIVLIQALQHSDFGNWYQSIYIEICK